MLELLAPPDPLRPPASAYPGQVARRIAASCAPARQSWRDSSGPGRLSLRLQAVFYRAPDCSEPVDDFIESLGDPAKQAAIDY